ncbi:LytR/AlgR family response regulator transcription factor [Taibaiella koreensis]|uniref:LytR/AlgR family response regulator transcription factor n=1 Tax=Taibaiella koreensis TaxID=1268548 RepID=UPI000E59A1B5|nr:LytTR family DNA-binding domain-containing protein [Taibaiella koreensis]
MNLPYNSFTAIIVEDEIPSQEYLTDLLATHFPVIKVLSVAASVRQAIADIDRHKPDIAFLDIAIKEGNSFEVLEQIVHKPGHIIFTTAYDQYAIDAFRHHAMDYLLKPLEADRVIETVHRCIGVLKSRQQQQGIDQLLQHFRQPARLPRIPVSTMYGMEFVEVADILYVEAEGNYSKLKLKGGKSFLLSKKIGELEEQLGGPEFIRIHHSYLVNIRYIRKYFKGRGGYITLDDDSSIPVARSKKEDFLKRFDEKI